MLRTTFLIAAAFLLLAPAYAQTTMDESPRRGTFALTNARIVTVTGGTIERGTLVIRNDRIAAVGSDVAIPPDAEVIDCSDLTIYPGLIDAGTRLGIAEIGAVEETNDYNEIGDVIPHMDALTAVNPNSVLIPVTRVSGVTTVLTEPSGGLLPGTAALINLHGYTPRQMNVNDTKALLLNFPSRAKTSSFDRRTKKKREEEFEKALKKLNEIWDRAELYARIDSAYRGNAEPSDRERSER
ncbi:MAG: amidohydrolase, partial [Rhodothermales bacterium]